MKRFSPCSCFHLPECGRCSMRRRVDASALPIPGHTRRVYPTIPVEGRQPPRGPYCALSAIAGLHAPSIENLPPPFNAGVLELSRRASRVPTGSPVSARDSASPRRAPSRHRSNKTKPMIKTTRTTNVILNAFTLCHLSIFVQSGTGFPRFVICPLCNGVKQFYILIRKIMGPATTSVWRQLN